MEIKSKDDLDNLVKNEVEENTNLEYKDPDSLNKNNEIAKDISAMANSNGGIIIYGLCEENRDHKPTKIKWLNDPQKKEKIEQVLQSSVTPKLNLNMTIIENPENKKEFVLVVEVPKSDSAPHQDHFDKDKRVYWRRNGYTTRQMEHYEIEDLFFKRKRPSLNIGLRSISNERDKPAFEIYLENVGKVVAEQTYIKLKTPSGWNIDGWLRTEDVYGYPSYEHILREDLVYPGLKQVVGIIYFPKKFELGLLKLNFLIVCRDMEVLEGEIFISYEGNLKVTYEIPKTHPYSQQMHDYIFSKNNPFNSK